MPGIDMLKDGNAGTDGLYLYPSTIDPKLKFSVTRIEIDGDQRAKGFSVVSATANSSSAPSIVKAWREAILALGAIHVPQVLELPRIGSASVLSAANIPQKADLPGDKNAAWMWLVLTGKGLNFGPTDQHPLSRGSVHINVSNSTGQPIFNYRAFSNPIGLATSIEMLRFIRKYMSSDFFAPYRPNEAESHSQHPVDTASKTPRELGGVVSEDLLVYEVKRLSIVDASIMPIIPGAPTQVTTYAIAEKAADLIKKRIH
ncbi:Nn.00g075280.m01.CDS01 [Neocucurbitaria sp. VM-36]